MSTVSAGRVMPLPKGAYDANTTYHVLDIVSYNSSAYIAKATTTGNLPTNTTYWQLIASGSAVASLDDIGNVHIVNPQNGQVIKYNAVTQMYENADDAGGLLPHAVITAPTGATVTISKGGTTISATETSSGVYEADVTDYGTWTVEATLLGATATATVSVDTVKVYNVTVAFFDATITVTYPVGATCTLSATGQSTQTATENPQTFIVHAAATYTVTATDGEDTASDTVTITTDGQSESVTLSFVVIPDGSTVLPINDVPTWLSCCASTSGSTHTTLSQVLADSTELNALLFDQNACDYLVRCKGWCSETAEMDLTASQTFMQSAGDSNVCADTLLADSDWLTAIANSQYIYYVLNVKVPTMTSANTPSGVVSASRENSDSRMKSWTAFDGSTSETAHGWYLETATTNEWIQYQFSQAVKIHCVKYRYGTGHVGSLVDVKASNDGSNFTQVADGETPTDRWITKIITSPLTAYTQWRATTTPGNNANGSIQIISCQFYGRQNV